MPWKATRLNVPATFRARLTMEAVSSSMMPRQSVNGAYFSPSISSVRRSSAVMLMVGGDFAKSDWFARSYRGMHRELWATAIKGDKSQSQRRAERRPFR